MDGGYGRHVLNLHFEGLKHKSIFLDLRILANNKTESTSTWPN